MQSVYVVGVVDPEGRLNDRQLHDELDACRTAQAKICSRRDAQPPVRGQRAGANAAGKGDRVAEHGYAHGSLGRPAKAVQAGVAGVGELLRRRDRNKRDRGNRANVKTANVRLAAHIKAAIGRRFPAAVSGDERARSVETQNVAVLVHRMVVLPIENVADALDVAAEPGKSERIKVALSTGGIDRIVDGVIGDRGSDGARNDSIQRAGTGDAAELHLGEQQLGSIVKCRNVGARQAVLQANARERKLPDGITGEQRESGAVLVVILNELRVDADGLAGEERGLAGLVKLVTAGKNREPRGNGPVEEIGLGKSEKEAARKIAELGRKRQSLAKTKEVVGLIGEADEAASQAADAALQPDRLFSFFLELEVDVYRAFFAVALDLRGLVGFDLVEVIELIEAQDAELPETFVEELAFIDHQLAANDFVARGSVAAKVDAPDEILLLLIKPQRQVDDFVGIVDFGVRLGSEVDESVFAVNFAVGLQGLAHFFGREDVALLEGKSALQRVDLQRQGLVRIGADDFESAHAEALALFDGDGDVDGLAVAASEDQRNAQAIALGVNIIENGFANGHLEIPIVAIQAANTDFQILAQFLAVVSLGKHRDVPEVERNGVGPVVAHGADQLAVAESVVPLEFYLADLDLRAFLNLENENDGVAGSNALVLRGDFRELTAVLAQ